MKYAIVEQGGKQYRAVEGATIDVDRLSTPVGEAITIDQVLLTVNDGSVNVGTPVVKGAKVKTTVLEHTKGKKILVFRYKARVRYRVHTGHRQKYTRLLVESIEE